MPGRIEKTVFISYRRTNLPWALAIFQNLKIEGYDVFFDYLSIPSGDFESIIVENIKARAHFIVILTPSALERCNEPGDWLRREIEIAMEENRNIVPLMLESFDFGSPSIVKALTGRLEKLKKYNGLRLHSEYFFEGMDRLRRQYLNVSLDTVIRPVSEEAKPVIEEHLTAASEAAPVEKEKLSAQEWLERGFAFQMTDNFDEAIRCYSESIRLQPNDSFSFMNRASSYIFKGDFNFAIADNTEAIKLEPNNANFYISRGVAHIGSGNPDEAIADYNQAIRIDPNSGAAYFNRGTAREAKNDLQGALTDYDSAIRVVPNMAIAYYQRGKIRRETNDFDGALQDFSEAIRLNPSDADYFSSRGDLFSMRGNNRDALSDYQNASKLKPEDGSTRGSLVRVLKSLGYQHEAEVQEKKTKELIQKETEYNQACFESICGNIEKALELLKVGLEKNQSRKEWARLDPDFENIRNDPRFKELLAE
jgi:tetratricopeptide (TPR) repeat protein